MSKPNPELTIQIAEDGFVLKSTELRMGSKAGSGISAVMSSELQTFTYVCKSVDELVERVRQLTITTEPAIRARQLATRSTT